MLKSWSIENFKPIVNSGELKLAPVTVLAGRNSSGKSSLLQSILMIKQTLSNQLPERALLPNEAIVQLGTYEDILNEASRSKKLTIAFEINFDREKIVSTSVEPVLLRTISNTKNVRIAVDFSSPSGNGKSSSAIEASKVSVDEVSLQIDFELNWIQSTIFPENDLEIKEVKSTLDIKAISAKELEEFLSNVSSDYLRLVPYTNEQSNYLGVFDINDERGVSRGLQPCLVALSHFLPTRLIRKFKVEERRKQSLERTLHYLFDYSSSLLSPNLVGLELDTPISEELRASIYEICKDSNIQAAFAGHSLRDLVTWFRATRNVGRSTTKKALSIKIQEIIFQSLTHNPEYLNKENAEGLESGINNIYAESLDQAIAKVNRFFTSQIRYLGPLRADPQASQKYAPSSELDNVGAKGEYAAAVYDANQNARIEWYNPVSQQIEQGTLKEALDHWARYLDVANQIKIEPAGQSGFSWQVVHKKGQRPLPLSAVGVGISQVLPILVMGLLSPNNTLLIVEQPELHLHPGVQARLGDFFIGLSKCKKQCLIETHSENLVSQLRYHIVQAGGMENSDCIIYFVDQDEKGAAKFEQVEISARGNIMNWPDGFFDETMHQEDRITSASIRRRAKLAKNG